MHGWTERLRLMESIDHMKRQICACFCCGDIQPKRDKKCDDTMFWLVVSAFLPKQMYASWNRSSTESNRWTGSMRSCHPEWSCSAPESCFVTRMPILSNHSSTFFSDDFRGGNYRYIPQS
jgi:hypothetical protein